jgi:hypothetical protein
VSDATSPTPAAAPRRTGRLDTAVKAVWLTIGILVLVGLVIAGISVLLSFAQSGGEPSTSSASSDKAPDGSSAGAALRYDAPVVIPGSRWRLMPVRRAADSPDPASSNVPARPMVNAIFLGSAGEARLLLDRPAYVRAVDVPGDSAGAGRGWLAYEVSFDDTDHDGRLGPGDRAGLFVSALDGSGFRAVLPAGVIPRAHAALGDGRMLLLGLAAPADTAVPERRWPERAFVFDPATGRTEALASVDSLAARAAAILAR